MTLMARRITQLLVGLLLYGIAIAMMVRAAVGVAPWEALTLGIMEHSDWSFAVIVNVTAVIVLLLWIPLRQKPGIGTVANVVLLGPFAQLGLAFIPMPTGLWQQALLFAGGLALLAVATGLYVGARFGPGPRDGLMVGIHNRWGFKLWWVRTAIEATVVAVGWLLGGDVGVGTLLFALLIGPMVGVTVPLLRVPERAAGAQVLEPAARRG